MKLLKSIYSLLKKSCFFSHNYGLLKIAYDYPSNSTHCYLKCIECGQIKIKEVDGRWEKHELNYSDFIKKSNKYALED